MNDTDSKPIEGEMGFITFKEIVEQMTGVSFEEVYQDYLLHGAKYEQPCDME